MLQKETDAYQPNDCLCIHVCVNLYLNVCVCCDCVANLYLDVFLYIMTVCVCVCNLILILKCAGMLPGRNVLNFTTLYEL